MSQDITNYKENLFSRIKKFFIENILRRRNKEIANNIKNKIHFSKDITVIQNEEEKRLRALKKLYDNREIEEEEISDEDIDKLSELYDKEIGELREDTERRKRNIEHIIRT